MTVEAAVQFIQHDNCCNKISVHFVHTVCCCIPMFLTSNIGYLH